MDSDEHADGGEARGTVAVLGAGGAMGLAMARSLLRAGMGVRAWNRTPEKARPLTDDGAVVLETAGEAAQGASMIVTMLSDADVTLEAMAGEHGAIAAAQGSTVWVQMGTVGIAGIARCEGLARASGVTLVDAPVLGTKQVAEEGKLVVLASCAEDEQLRARLTPVFAALGQRTIWVGELGAGTRLKLVANSWVLTVVEGCAEAFALAEGLGLDPTFLLEAVAGGTLDLPYLRIKGQAILERDFEPAFRLALAAKDARLIAQAAQEHGLQLPLFATIGERLAQGVPDHGDEDMIATYWTSAPDGAGTAMR